MIGRSFLESGIAFRRDNDCLPMNESPPPVAVNESRLQSVMNGITRVVCLALIVVTAATFLARHHWVADLLANLRIQQLIAIVFLITISLFARQYRLATIASVCGGIHLVMMAAQLWPQHLDQTSTSNAIRLMSVNVLSSNRSHGLLIEEIRRVDPDVVSILELTSVLQERLDAELSDEYPYSVARADDFGNFGIGLYSKHRLDKIEVFTLNEAINSIAVNCQGYHLIATHPLPPMRNQMFRSRNEHLSMLGGRVKQLNRQSPDVPVAVMGDLNLTPWSPLFGDFEKASGLRRAKSGFGITPTWYARFDQFPFGLVLDHFLISDSLGCSEYRVGNDCGSDHRSVSVRLGMKTDKN